MPRQASKSRSPRERVLRLALSTTVLRPKDLASIGVPREYLKRLRDEGILDHPSRGIYILAGAELTENQSLVEACKRVPQGVICLISALRFHGLTTQMPHEVWLAIGGKAWRPQITYPPLRIARFSKAALEYGVEDHRISGVNVRVYTPAKTVADCFKFRYKVGLDVALESLRDCLRKRKASVDDIWKAAKVCRVANVMRPYLEALM